MGHALGLGAVVALCLAIGARAEAATLTATVDGKAWTANDVQTSYRTTTAGEIVSISARSTGTPVSFFAFGLVWKGDGTPPPLFELSSGSPLKISHGTFNANPLAGDPLETSFTITKGRFAIETFDKATQTITGHFSATATNGAKTKTIAITDGTFAGVGFDTVR